MTIKTGQTRFYMSGGGNPFADADPRILGYMEDALSGKILVCKKINKACNRMLEDLRKVGRPGFRWVFDCEKASRPIRFMEKFMVPSGDYDRLELMPWQCLFEGNLFGWRHKDTGVRKYQKALLLVGSGNGKSPLIAGTALYFVSQEGVKDVRVDVFANSRDQAQIIVNDCGTMVDTSAVLSKHFKVLTGGIRYEPDKSRKNKELTIQARSSEARNMDGIRPTVALFDEVHQMRTYRMITHAERSLRKAKDNQLMALLSTMGTVLDGVLVNEYAIGESVLNGDAPPEVADSELVMIYELDEEDSPEDSKAWIKANPSLGVLLREEDLKASWGKAQFTPQLKADFITKTCNIFTKADEASFLEEELVTGNDGEIDLEELRGCDAYGGFDMASSEDHCSAAVTVVMADGRVVVLTHSWVPQAKADRSKNILDYQGMADEGLLTIVPGHYVKQEKLIEWFDEMAQLVNIRKIGYDPANASLLVRALTSYRGEGKTVFECEMVRQGALTFNDPMKRVHEKFIDRLIVYNKNRLFRWYLNNVKLKKEEPGKERENWMPSKVDKLRKIDGFMAFLDCYVVYMREAMPDAVQEPEPEVRFYQLGLW